MVYVQIHRGINLLSLSKLLSFSNRACVFVWTSENDSKTLFCEQKYFLNGRKKFAFSNENGYIWTGH